MSNLQAKLEAGLLLTPSEEMAWRATPRFTVSGQGIDRPLSECQPDIIDLFKGLDVLEIGAGATARMAREARAQGVDVVALNPNWGQEDFNREHEVKAYSADQPMIAGIGEQLPISSERFDVVFSFFGLPAHLLNHPAHHRAFVSEVQRVLRRPHGFGIFIHLHAADREMLSDALEQVAGPDAYRLETSPFASAVLIGKDAAALNQPLPGVIWQKFERRRKYWDRLLAGEVTLQSAKA